MTDRVFFLGAFIVAGLMVALGLLPGFNALPSGPVSGGNTDYSAITVSGTQLNRLVAGGDSRISLEQVDGRTVLRIEVEAGALSALPLQGPHFILATDLETVFSGRQIKITVNARAADRHGAEGIRLNYALGNATASGWKEFQMTREFQDVSFTYNVPVRAVGHEPGYDYFAIRPVVPEKQRAVYVASVTFQPIGPPPGEKKPK